MVSTANKIAELFNCNVITFTDKKSSKEQASNRDTLINEITNLKRELVAANRHFDWETNFELIDADIYHLNELETRYGYLIKQAKLAKIQAFN